MVEEIAIEEAGIVGNVGGADTARTNITESWHL